jgi:hypothetical protein
MTNEDRITGLEAQIRKLQAEQAELRMQLAKAQLDRWRGRIEDLEVQMHLGAMEAGDEPTALMRQLRGKSAMPGGRSKRTSPRRPAWRTPCAPGSRPPSTISARRSLKPRTSWPDLVPPGYRPH